MITATIILFTIAGCTLFFGTWILLMKEKHKKETSQIIYENKLWIELLKANPPAYTKALGKKILKLEGNENND